MVKTCKLCGREFETSSNVQQYCNKPVVRECLFCHKQFETKCNIQSPEFCSHACASQGAVFKTYYCAICGSPFHPKSSRQKYCKKPLKKICPICNEEFEYPCSDFVPSTCNKTECRNKYAHEQLELSYQKYTKICEWCGKEFHPISNTQRYCTGVHYRNCKICGKQFEVDVTKNFQDIPWTCSNECMLKLRFQNGNPFQNPDSREKARQTLLKHYGVEHPMQSKELVDKLWKNYQEKTGYTHSSHNPDVRSRRAKASKVSKLEEKVLNLFNQYNIHCEHHYMLNSDSASHEFDFYLPDYKILIDCDGLYYHSYLEDPDGKNVLDYYDEDRLSLIPKDHIFHVIVEGQEEKDIKQLVDIIKMIDSNSFDYEGYLFNWCRSIEFPYPVYTDQRMQKDFLRLKNYNVTNYNPASRMGDSIIQNFHHSIYDAHVGNYVSPVEAWYDDKLLNKVILNRLIYQNDVEPSKILRGFNISKICPRVSVFNPVLAKHIVIVYLKDYEIIFDPFSGFSGRLLGVAASSKHYVGQDLNSTAVKESNQIIDFLNLENCSVSVKDIFESSGEYDCLMTCPPYGKKEHYSAETVFKSCDEWIDECLSRFKCKKYVFVVDKTERYKANIVEEIKSTSHYSRLREYVVVI